MAEPTHGELRADIAVLKDQMQRVGIDLGEVRKDVRGLMRARDIETGKKALKATLWTAVAGGAGAGIHALLRLLDGSGGQPPPGPWGQ